MENGCRRALDRAFRHAAEEQAIEAPGSAGAEHDQIGARLVRSLQQLVKGHPDRAEVLMRQPAFESLRAAASTLFLAARCRPRSMFAISAERRLLTVVGIMAMDDGRTGSSTLTTIARPRG